MRRPFARAFLVGRPTRPGPFTLGARKLQPPPRRARASCTRAADTEPTDAGGNAGVYVLELPDGRYYVGKSTAIDARLRQHAAGEGASCARGYLCRVPPITPRASDLEAWERSETLARMHRHGIARVRGWMYTTPGMGHAQHEHAFRQVCEKLDLCRRCGRAGHFITACRGGPRPRWASSCPSARGTPA
jgi:predicted GIY-YIG superfamily endonuclease